MAPISPSNTERWWVEYITNGVTHKLQMRTTAGATNTSVSLTFHGLFNRLSPILNDLDIVGLERALQGSNVRNPFAWTQSASYGLGTEVATDGRVRTVSFVGRDITGRRVRLFVYGVKSEAQGDYRIDGSENSDIDAALTYLQGITTAFLTITGTAPVWKDYVNVDYNDYWTRQLR